MIERLSTAVSQHLTTAKMSQDAVKEQNKASASSNTKATEAKGKVEELKEKIQKGEYTINLSATADKMAHNLLGEW